MQCHMSADIQGPAVRRRTKPSHDQVHIRPHFCIPSGFGMGVPGGAPLRRKGSPYLLLIVKCDIIVDLVLNRPVFSGFNSRLVLCPPAVAEWQELSLDFGPQCHL